MLGELTPVAAWDDRATPFQLVGRPGRAPASGWPALGRRRAGTRLLRHLRTIHTRILRRIGLGLLGLSDQRWRNGYDARLHPWKAADKAIANEDAEMGCGL